MKPSELVSHPEGGRYQEVFRSQQSVQVKKDGRERDGLTHIYFELNAGEVSRFHRVLSDEIWNLYQGGIRLILWDGSENLIESELSAESGHFCEVVPAGWWQATEVLEGHPGALTGCSVAPGFDFQDFDLIDPESAEAEYLSSKGLQRFC